MLNSFFVSDIHGSIYRYEKLFELILQEKPEAVFIGGDILPSGLMLKDPGDFLSNGIIAPLKNLKSLMGKEYPNIFLILGNDDGKQDEERIMEEDKNGLWSYIHNRKIIFKERSIFGYSYIPPTPFLMKDWEKYDVSRYSDPGCISPEEGKRTYEAEPNFIRYTTIKKDLEILFKDEDISNSVLLFHSPPYKTNLDRADLGGKFYDSVPLDVNVGSIAIKEMIEERQPYLSLHGHIHESSRLTGRWDDIIGRTRLFSAAYDGRKLAVVKFDLDDPSTAIRSII
ncbi:MAG: hypothetical protein R6V47_01235 [Candidatus Delongbacteria bacterium]